MMFDLSNIFSGKSKFTQLFFRPYEFPDGFYPFLTTGNRMTI